jgi:hypothetical protein
LKFAKTPFLFVILVLVVGCALKSEYRYFEELKKYIRLRFDFELGDYDGTLLLIPVGGCASCVKESLELAADLPEQERVIVLLLADNQKKYLPYQSLIKKIHLKDLFIENEGKHNYYELGIFSPVVIKLKSNRVILYQELNTQNIHQVTHEIFGM